MASHHQKLSEATKEMQPQRQMNQFTYEPQKTWEAGSAHQNQILKTLKYNLHAHSMRLAEMCSKYSIESQQADTAQLQELKIIEKLQKDMRELEEKLEQTMLKIAAVNSNCQPLQAKVESTVQFGKALSEHRPRMKKSVAEVKTARNQEQVAVDALDKEVKALLADYKSLDVKFVNDLTQLRNEVIKERETRIAAIAQHNQRISEIEGTIKETQLLSCKEQAINADHQTAIENEKKQMMALQNERQRDETEFKAEHSRVQSKIDEIQSHLPKHREGLERGIAMKNDYQKLLPLMKELEINRKESEECLITIGMEKIQITEKLEFSTNVKMSGEQEIAKTLAEIDKCVAIEQAMINDRAILVEKLQQMEENLVEKNAEESALKVNLEDLKETQMNINKCREELVSKYNLVQSSIEKVNLDIQVNEGELQKAKKELSDLEEKVNAILGEINQVEIDNETVVAGRMEIERTLNETRSQLEEILAAKADLVKQVEAIDSKLENVNMEKMDMTQRINEVELEVQSMVKENEALEEKIKAANSSSENLKCQILEKKSDVEVLQTMIDSTREEIRNTVKKIDGAKADIETFTNDFTQTSLLVESARLTREQVTVENCALKAELEIANEIKQRKNTEIQIIEDELAINLAMEEANKNQEEILNHLKQELAREEKERIKMCAELQRTIDEKTVTTEESLKKLASLQEKRNADFKAIANVESDIARNRDAEMEIALKLKELEESGAQARVQHEERLHAIAEEERVAAEGSRSLEELKAHLESATEEHIKEKAKVDALEVTVKDLEKALGNRKIKIHDDPELAKKNEQLKQEGHKLEKELQKNLESKTVRRSEVRTVSKQWFADMAALKVRLAKEQNKLQELSAASPNVSNTRPSKSPTAKSPNLGEATSSGSKSSTKNTPNSAKKLKEKSPRISTLKEKSPIVNSPIISGSHNIRTTLTEQKVRKVERWHVNASSTPISTQNSNFQENSSPNEIQNSPPILTSSLKKKRKTHQ